MSPRQISGAPRRGIGIYLLAPTNRVLSKVQFKSRKAAQLTCQLIPAHCPFERDVQVLGCRFHIPPLCKLNPFYDDLIALRFQALIFLADTCGEDVSRYCH
jgi:hypothetical protein